MLKCKDISPNWRHAWFVSPIHWKLKMVGYSRPWFWFEFPSEITPLWISAIVVQDSRNWIEKFGSRRLTPKEDFTVGNILIEETFQLTKPFTWQNLRLEEILTSCWHCNLNSLHSSELLLKWFQEIDTQTMISLEETIHLKKLLIWRNFSVNKCFYSKKFKTWGNPSCLASIAT